MLKEGWDVRNDNSCWFKSYSHKAEILPEQTVGRGLRMFKDKNEKLAVIGENFDQLY